MFIYIPNHPPIGQFRLYFEREQNDNPSRRRMLSSLAGLLSQQYAFVESERQAQLLADAEIRSLQAQMNPHFLFNVLNTVKSFIRTKPEEARQMVMHLSKFLRKNMSHNNQRMITIRDEYELVMSYLSLIKSRLGDQMDFMLKLMKAYWIIRSLHLRFNLLSRTPLFMASKIRRESV